MEPRLRILLIESDAPVMRLMAWALTQEDFDVEIISPRKAMELRGLDGPDAAVFNMSASSEDKKAYIRHLRMLHPHCVMIDVDQFGAGGGSVRDSDADSYMLRPLTLNDVVESIRTICGQTIEERRSARGARNADQSMRSVDGSKRDGP
jgi:DNA-binding response OmpR family regulator